jgi:ubiquinone/menaquinone biosynthesis C-methylase UbiE
MLILADPKKYADKEQLYYEVRNKEGRIISDDELKNLPLASDNNPHEKEWSIRAANFQRFKKYLSKNYGDKQLKILDIGCGNGWMAHQLNGLGHHITAVDLNMSELAQAEKVFGNSDTLQWMYADVLNDHFPMDKYDVIALAASCQYFEDITQLTQKLKSLLSKHGAIHLLDSVFYKNKQQEAARARSLQYYALMGYASMCEYYFHHSTESLIKNGYKKLYPSFFSSSPVQWWTFTGK